MADQAAEDEMRAMPAGAGGADPPGGDGSAALNGLEDRDGPPHLSDLEHGDGSPPEADRRHAGGSRASLAGLPIDALVLLIGPAGSGKSTWARRNVRPGAVLSSDEFRALVADEPTDQAATADAFRALHAVAGARLRRGLLTVVDATNLTASARRTLRALAARNGRPALAVVFDISLQRCLAQNAARPERQVAREVVRRQHEQLREALPAVRREGYHDVLILRDVDLKAG